MDDQILVRPSGKLIAFYLTGFVLVLLVGRFATLSFEWAIYGWGVVLVVGLLYFVFSHLTRISKIYTLDSSNLTSQTGILSKQVTKIPLNRITNYRVSQTFSERLMGLGDVSIDTAGGSGVELEVKEMEITEIERFVRRLDQLLAQQRLAQKPEASEQNSSGGA